MNFLSGGLIGQSHSMLRTLKITFLTRKMLSVNVDLLLRILTGKKHPQIKLQRLYESVNMDI